MKAYLGNGTSAGRLLRLSLVLLVSALLIVGSFLAGSTIAGLHARASAPAPDTEKAAIGEIYQLQAAFHRAKTNQDIDLMMSLWAPDGVLHVQGDPNSPYVGAAALRSFWLNSGSFKNHRLSLVPSFKTTIDVQGAQANLYFECHDVGNYDQPIRTIVARRHDRRQELAACGRPLLLSVAPSHPSCSPGAAGVCASRRLRLSGALHVCFLRQIGALGLKRGAAAQSTHQTRWFNSKARSAILRIALDQKVEGLFSRGLRSLHAR